MFYMSEKYPCELLKKIYRTGGFNPSGFYPKEGRSECCCLKYKIPAV